MKNTLFFLTIALVASIEPVGATNPNKNALINIEIPLDSVRLAELNHYWSELSRTVREGDFKGYSAAYHKDAVVVFATKKNKVSVPITSALENWEQGFKDTKEGKKKDNVEFRFSERIGSETTAHETGIFRFTSPDSDGNLNANYVHFEMLLIKRNHHWYSLMEYQKSQATKGEWDELE